MIQEPSDLTMSEEQDEEIEPIDWSFQSKIDQEKYKWGQGFSLNSNYHTRNWLIDIVQDYPNAKIVTVEQLDDYTRSLGVSPKRTNVSSKREIERITEAYQSLRNVQAFANYLEPEILAYQQLTR